MLGPDMLRRSWERGQDDTLFRPLFRINRITIPIAAILMAVVAWGGWAWWNQWENGLGETGLNRPVYWGVYVTNFIFFIGISHAGTLISAILRVTHAGWRRPITRCAEAITVFALMVGPINIFFDLGRPDRILYPFIFGRFQSPLLWDVTAISTYFTGSIIYLYLPLIPDIAMMRDRLSVGSLRYPIYNALSMGWQGTETQVRRLNRAISILAVAIIPVAVSVHTVVSWVLAMTLQPMWHSAIFGPYFVVGAIFSGIATLMIVMAILRKVLHLEEYLTAKHFNYLALLLLAMTILWLYFTFSEYMTVFYGDAPDDMRVFYSKINGEFAWPFWTMIITCFGIPFFILALPWTRKIPGIVVASVLINIGMWLERYTIVVPTLSRPRMEWDYGIYFPSWVEISITLAEFAFFALLYIIFAKIFPMVAVWENQEGREEEHIKELAHKLAAEAEGTSR